MFLSLGGRLHVAFDVCERNSAFSAFIHDPNFFLGFILGDKYDEDYVLSTFYGDNILMLSFQILYLHKINS